MKWSAEAKVGLVTIVGVLLFTFVVLTLAHAEIFGKPGFVVHTEFKDANGLQKGNSVRYVGVHVGKVESVKPSRDGVDVAMKLEKGTEIPRDSKVTITTDGLLGEKIVSITPGNDKNHLLADGDYISGAVRLLDAILVFLCIAIGVGVMFTAYQRVAGGVLL